MNEPVIISSTNSEKLKDKSIPSFRTMIKPLIPAGFLFIITFAFTLLFTQFSQIFIQGKGIDYIGRGLILASIFFFLMITIKLTTILKQKISSKNISH
ncbi:MAG: hypothetical protein GXX85_01395 [Ignavibacteria bacterium]|nr:hypothetical protein [Ignavibacteria bacterium]